MSDQAESSQKPSVFNSLRLEGHFCDAVIEVQDVEFDIHRIILCQCSPFFLSVFGPSCDPDKKVFVLGGLSPDMMRLIIEFAYTGSVSVTPGNVQELLVVAEQLGVTEVVQACCRFLGEQLQAANCIGIVEFTDVVLPEELRRKAHRYILDHFEEVARHGEFLQLPLEQLADLLQRDDLNVRTESVAFEAVVRWIAHDPGERTEHAALLLSKVRLALTSLSYMRLRVLTNELVTRDTECMSLAQSALQAVGHVRTGWPSVADLSNPLARPRLPNAILLAIGGWSGGNPTNVMEAYDIRADCWFNVTEEFERPRAYHGTALLGGSVYCVGGFDRKEHFNCVRRMDLSTRVWHEAAPMCHRRCYVSVTALGGCIYAMGGYDGYSRLNTAERYRPEANQWSLIAPMHEHRSDACSTTLNNRVYICGGFNGTECLQTAECYIPETNQWTMIGLMNSRRSGNGVIAYAGCVYAVGGFDGNNRLCSAEMYNPESNSWSEVTPMLTPRSNFGIEVLNDLIFVAGGYNGNTTSYDVESYDRTTNQWTVACDMDIFRSALSCCVVSGLPNMADYTVPRDALPFLNGSENPDEHTDLAMMMTVPSSTRF